MQKVDMGIAIVCMINNTALKEASSAHTFLNNSIYTGSTDSHSIINSTLDDSECRLIKSASKKFVTFANIYLKFYI